MAQPLWKISWQFLKKLNCYYLTQTFHSSLKKPHTCPYKNLNHNRIIHNSQEVETIQILKHE